MISQTQNCAFYIMSTGRVSTQFLARQFSTGYPEAKVVHEPIGTRYKPTKVFRRNNFGYILLSTPLIAKHFRRISFVLENGRSHIETGWPSYAWIPYLERRFGDTFKFAHLVRNPFFAAASLATTDTINARYGRENEFGIINPFLRNTVYSKHKEAYSTFSIYEQALYHWLEVNQFILDNHYRKGFVGLYRFEDLYSNDDHYLRRLFAACGFEPKSFVQQQPYDRFQRTTSLELTTNNTILFNDVVELAIKLGYSRDDLEGCFEANNLNNTYAKGRLAENAGG